MSLDNTSQPSVKYCADKVNAKYIHGRPEPELVPSRYALRVGEIDVMVVSDGVLSLPGAMLGHNVDPAVRAAWLEDMFQRRTHRPQNAGVALNRRHLLRSVFAIATPRGTPNVPEN